MKVASIDIGTNTIRLLIAMYDKNLGKLKPLRRERIVTRLGDSFIVTGYLKDEAIERTISGLAVFKSIVEEEGCDRIIAVATSCVRESANGREFVRLVKERLGIDVIVVDGNKEAYLTYLGIKKGLDIQGSILMFDIGGGSTEYIYSTDGQVKTLSIPIGVVKLRDTFMQNDPPTEKEISEMREFIDSQIAVVEQFKCRLDSLIGTAGTVTTLAAIKLNLEKYDPEIIHGVSVSYDEIVSIFDMLKVLPAKERLKIKGMEEGREDLIIPGILITLSTCDILGCREVVVSEWGILEGIVFYYA